MYFTQEHETAILRYCNSKDRKEKEHLYIQWIQPAFDQMVDKIVFSYKFTSLPNIDELRLECKVWLTTILNKYDPNKGSKAFSYFSVILKREVPYEEAERELETTFVDPGDQYYQNRVSKEFWSNLWEEIESWNVDFDKESERKVYEAVKIILSSVDDIEIFNKKAVYLYLREITGMSTKQIVTQLNKMRTKYRDFKDDWDNGKI